MTRVITGFFLGVGTMLVLQSPNGRKILSELGNTVSDIASSRINEVKSQFVQSMKRNNLPVERS